MGFHFPSLILVDYIIVFHILFSLLLYPNHQQFHLYHVYLIQYMIG